MGKVANFLTFPKFVNGRLRTTFCSQIMFSMVGRELKWSKLPQFHKGGPCREQQEGEMTNQKRCLVIHVAHNFWVIFLLKHLSLGEIWGWEPFFGQKVPQVLRTVGGAFAAPLPHALDRVNCQWRRRREIKTNSYKIACNDDNARYAGKEPNAHRSISGGPTTCLLGIGSCPSGWPPHCHAGPIMSPNPQ